MTLSATVPYSPRTRSVAAEVTIGADKMILSVAVRARSYRHVESILKNGLDRLPLQASPPPPAPLQHENLRGRDYYN